jgi:hypothetical protein
LRGPVGVCATALAAASEALGAALGGAALSAGAIDAAGDEDPPLDEHAARKAAKPAKAEPWRKRRRFRSNRSRVVSVFMFLLLSQPRPLDRRTRVSHC